LGAGNDGGNDGGNDVSAVPFQAKAPVKPNKPPLELTFEDSADERQVKMEKKEQHQNLNPLGESSRWNPLKDCWTKKCKDDKKRKKDAAERNVKTKQRAEQAQKQQERQQKGQETAEARNALNMMQGNHANAQANAKADAAAELQRKAGEKAEEGEREKLQKGDEERTVKSEQSMKKGAKAAAASNENAKKEALAEADRKAKNAENKMQESNVKAADADTQNRKCEGAMFRRRRTCACDDMPGRKMLLDDEVEEVRLGEGTGTPPHLEGIEKQSTMAKAGHQSAMANIAADEVRGKKEANYERRRYVRRRYVKPTAADRRRRYAFPAPPPPARVPGKVCPCCTKDSDNPECKKSNKGEREL